jgi:hypothetical protein
MDASEIARRLSMGGSKRAEDCGIAKFVIFIVDDDIKQFLVVPCR